MAVALNELCRNLSSYPGKAVVLQNGRVQVGETVLSDSFSPTVPISRFTLTSSPKQDDLRRFLLGLSTPDPDITRKSKDIGRSILSVETDPKPNAVHFPVFGFLKSHFIPVNPSPVDLFANEVLRKWIGDNWHKVGESITFVNEWQKLTGTIFAYLTLPPPEYDDFCAEIAYEQQGIENLQAIFSDPEKKEAFRAFSANAVEISRTRRYQPFIGFMLTSSLFKACLEKDAIRILDVGGGLYTREHGAPAAKYMLATLKRMFPEKTFEVVVTDIHFPRDWGNAPSDTVDAQLSNVRYMLHDITTGPLMGTDGSGFDIVICNRVLTQPDFQEKENKDHDPKIDKENEKIRANRNNARVNLYNSLRDQNSFLFLDQGYSPWIEIYQKDADDINKTRYKKTLTRTDKWFLFTQLELASFPDYFINPENVCRYFSESGTAVFEWANAAKYVRTLSETDKRQALLLWRILHKNDFDEITPKIKEDIFPGFLKDLRAKNSAERQVIRAIIDRISNPNTFDLRGIAELERTLEQAGLHYRVNKEVLVESKIGKNQLDQLIPAKLGLVGTFRELGGWIEEVLVIEETDKIRIYKIRFKFLEKDKYNTPSREVIVKAMPSNNSSEDLIIVEKAEKI